MGVSGAGCLTAAAASAPISAHMETHASQAFGLEYDFDRAQMARLSQHIVVCGASEHLPFPSDSFDLILSHEVLEHVDDDRQSVRAMLRILRKGGRLVVFVPNRGYPFETHGIFWRGRYHFGNMPLVNYLPRILRDKLAPHVRIYSAGPTFVGCSMDCPVEAVSATTIFGAYDNLIARWPTPGRILRAVLQGLERTSFRASDFPTSGSSRRPEPASLPTKQNRRLRAPVESAGWIGDPSAGLALRHRHPGPSGGPDINGARPDQDVVFDLLQDVGRPSAHASHGEHR